MNIAHELGLAFGYTTFFILHAIICISILNDEDGNWIR